MYSGSGGVCGEAKRHVDVDELRDLWPLGGSWVLHPTESGTNNVSYVVETPAGRSYLRVYQNTADEDRLRYEHALLLQLRDVGLSFAVPAPRPTRTGVTYARLQSAGGALVALCPLIPGRHPARQDPREAGLCGAALGELDAALARIALAKAPGAPSSFTDLAHIHPLMPAPGVLPPELPVAHDIRLRLQEIVAALVKDLPTLVAALPQQIIHGDYGASNILVDEGQVRGVLDFEFASPDARVIDFAVGLTMFIAYGWDSGTHLALGGAFSAAYLAACPLEAAEVAAVPLLMRFYRTVSLIHRAGRYRQGLADAAEVTERVAALLHLDTWLSTHQREMAQLLHHPRTP